MKRLCLRYQTILILLAWFLPTQAMDSPARGATSMGAGKAVCPLVWSEPNGDGMQYASFKEFAFRAEPVFGGLPSVKITVKADSGEPISFEAESLDAYAEIKMGFFQTSPRG